MDKKKLVLIDFSSLFYSVSYNCSIDPLKKDDFNSYKETLDFYVKSIFDDTKADYYLCFGDSSSSFRKKEFTEFKGDRDKSEYRQFITDLKHYATEKYHIIFDSKLEADDMVLIAANIFKVNFDTIICSKDSDLRQFPGTFYNYGWRQTIYKKSGGDPTKDELTEGLTNAFEVISPEEAEFTLWKQVLIKGHNNKFHYLQGCGKQTAINYLEYFKISQLRLATLKAFIDGINKLNFTGVKRNVQGYGLLKGIQWFNNAFRQSYLLRTLEEVKLIHSEDNYLKFKESLNPYLIPEKDESVDINLFS